MSGCWCWCCVACALRDFHLGRAFTLRALANRGGGKGDVANSGMQTTYVGVLRSSELCDPLFGHGIISLVLAVDEYVSDTSCTAIGSYRCVRLFTWKDRDTAALGAAARHWRRTGAATARRASIMKSEIW